MECLSGNGFAAKELYIFPNQTKVFFGEFARQREERIDALAGDGQADRADYDAVQVVFLPCRRALGLVFFEDMNINAFETATSLPGGRP